MFARSVSFHLKPGRAAEFTQLFDKDIIPVLRKQKGFQDEIALVAPGGADAVGISVWDLKENAETMPAAGMPVCSRRWRRGRGHAKVQTVRGLELDLPQDACSRDRLKTGRRFIGGRPWPPAVPCRNIKESGESS